MDRTDRRLLLAIRLVVVPGFLAATYLTYSKVFDKAIACGGGCEVIQISKWSELFGIPVTALGMATYILIFGSTFLKNDAGKLIGAFFAVVGAAFSIWLQYYALVKMQHLCPYCLTSAICMQFLAGLTIWRAFRLPNLDDYAGGGDEDDDSVAAVGNGGEALA